MKKFAFAAIAVMMFATVASAQESESASLTVTGMIESSINFTIEAAGGTVSGEGTAAVTSALGSFSKYDLSAPAGFTLTSSASDYTLSSTIGVLVEKANLDSANYTLSAQLASAPATGVVWKVNDLTLSDSAAVDVDTTAGYAETETYSWDIVIADSAANGPIDNTINFIATSN
jgi:hypothetical protein